MCAYRFRKGRGQFTAPTSRSGKSYNFAGRSVRISGSNFELTWNGPALADMILEALKGAFSELSNEGLQYMQGIVPVDTGRLHDSCFVNVIENAGRVQLVIGADTPYAVYVELGTSGRSAQPYLRPTYDFIVEQLPNIIRAEIRQRGSG